MFLIFHPQKFSMIEICLFEFIIYRLYIYILFAYLLHVVFIFQTWES